MILPLPPCPGKDDVVRHYEVAAVQTKLTYNRYGDHDPNGLIFVPLEDVDLALTGNMEPASCNPSEICAITGITDCSGRLL